MAKLFRKGGDMADRRNDDARLLSEPGAVRVSD
jgi:hypothetical protein